MEYIFDKEGNPLGVVQGTYIRDMEGNPVGQLKGEHVHKLSGGYVGELHDGIPWHILRGLRCAPYLKTRGKDYLTTGCKGMSIRQRLHVTNDFCS